MSKTFSKRAVDDTIHALFCSRLELRAPRVSTTSHDVEDSSAGLPVRDYTILRECSEGHRICFVLCWGAFANGALAGFETRFPSIVLQHDIPATRYTR